MRRVANQPLQYWIDSPIELSQLKQAQASSFPSLLRASIMSWSACLHSKKMQHLGIKYSNWLRIWRPVLLWCLSSFAFVLQPEFSYHEWLTWSTSLASLTVSPLLPTSRHWGASEAPHHETIMKPLQPVQLQRLVSSFASQCQPASTARQR